MNIGIKREKVVFLGENINTDTFGKELVDFGRDLQVNGKCNDNTLVISTK